MLQLKRASWALHDVFTLLKAERRDEEDPVANDRLRFVHLLHHHMQHFVDNISS